MPKVPAAFRPALALAGAFLLLAVLEELSFLEGVDARGILAVAEWRSAALTSLMRAISWFGDGNAMAPLAFLLTGWIARARGRRAALGYFLSALTGWALYGVLKAVFARPRPSVVPRLDGAGWWSFPSGHAMSSAIIFGLAVILLTDTTAYPRRVVWIRGVVFAFILAVAFSRVYLGVHYPSDVVAGVLAGAGWTSATRALMDRQAPQSPPPSGRP
ncbi:MAG: phosphatase PAP2 family protein [Gemmatimonadales bacterium]|nr:phosphatase PAP2 family protein [Gemmatimonadales bacterium]